MLSIIDTETIKKGKMLKRVCSRCGKQMELTGYFPEPADYPNPIANFRCTCGIIATAHYIGSKLRSVMESFS